jgi:hypothetical protein
MNNMNCQSTHSQLHQECAFLNFDDADLILAALAEGDHFGNNGGGKRSRDELELNDITCNEIKRLRQIMAMEPTHTRSAVATATATTVMVKAAPVAAQATAEAQKDAPKPCAPYFYYKDYSLHPDPSPETPLTLPGRIPSFPVKMHAILSRPDLADIVSWMPHGRSWRVWKPREFEVKVIPTYFEHNKFSSFIRQANGWGFRRITTKGPDRNSYYHELFLQGVPHLAKMMQRPSANQKPVSDASTEPNFYAIAQDRPLPHQQGSMKDEAFEDQANSILAQCTIVQQAHTFSGQLITGSDGTAKQEPESLTARRNAAISALSLATAEQANTKLPTIDFIDFEPLPLHASSPPQEQHQHQSVAVASAPQPVAVSPVAAAATPRPVAAPQAQLARRAPPSPLVSASAMLQYANRRLKYNTPRQAFASSLTATPKVLYYGNHTFIPGPDQQDSFKSVAMPHTTMSAPLQQEQSQQMQKAPNTIDLTSLPEPTVITSMGVEDTLTNDDLATLYEDSIDFWAL